MIEASSTETRDAIINTCRYHRFFVLTRVVYLIEGVLGAMTTNLPGNLARN